MRKPHNLVEWSYGTRGRSGVLWIWGPLFLLAFVGEDLRGQWLQLSLRNELLIFLE
jgi:hypothetical protein